MSDLIKRLRARKADRTLHEAAADEIERLTAERDALRAALVELVACKDLKDDLHRLRSDPYYITQADAAEIEYRRCKPVAWAAARAAIDAARKDKP